MNVTNVICINKCENYPKCKPCGEMNTHTRITFCVKDEPILGMIQKEFEDYDFDINWKTDDSRYKTLELSVNKIVGFDNEDQIVMEGYKVQFEDLTYYNEAQE